MTKKSEKFPSGLQSKVGVKKSSPVKQAEKAVVQDAKNKNTLVIEVKEVEMFTMEDVDKIKESTEEVVNKSINSMPVVDYKNKKQRTFVKYIFTQSEIVEKSTMLASRNNTINNLKDDLASIKNEYKAKIDNEYTLFNELLNEVGNGYKMVEKECDVVMMDPVSGMKSYYYEGEFVKSDTMMPSEYQHKLEFDPSVSIPFFDGVPDPNEIAG